MTKGILLAMLVTGTAWSQVKVSVAGLKVVSEPYKVEGSDDELRAFNWSPGTEVALLLETTGKSIVELDRDHSTVAVFGDDQGSDFLKVKSRFSSKSYSFDMMPQKTEDGKALLTEVQTPGVPVKGAKFISLKGEIQLSVASKSEVKKSARIKVGKGEKLVVAGQSFTIDKVGKPDWGDDALEISFTGSYDPKDFQSFEFFDGEGKKLKSKQGSWSVMGGGGILGKKKVTVTYSFENEVKEISVVAGVWTDLEKLAVPFDLKIGAGL